MAWRPAKSLVVLKDQIIAAYPGVPKKNFGMIGDEKHRSRESEHNPDSNGVVRALDVPNDPAHGVYARQIAEEIAKSKDPRILYIISNSQIVRSYPRSGTTTWKWAPYFGTNPHTAHAHFSVVKDPKLYDKVALWSLPKKLSTPADARIQRGITATTFDDTRLAYDDVPAGHLERFGVALPYRFPPGPRPRVRIWPTDEPELAEIADIIDVGPWVISDPFWVTGKRPQAEREHLKLTSGPNAGKRTNKAGIDVTPALDKALGLRGKGLVDWEFVK